MVGRTNAGGTAARVATGTLKTNASGKATVSLGFQPDVVIVSGFNEGNAHYCCGYDFELAKGASGGNHSGGFDQTHGDYGVEVEFTRSASGFTITAYGYKTSSYNKSYITSYSMSYTAIKYT